MKRKLILAVLFIGISFILVGCNLSKDNLDNLEADEVNELDTNTMFTERDLESEVDLDDYEVLSLTDNKNITITASGSYRFSGSAKNSTIIVDVLDTEKVYLVFDEVQIECENYASLYIKSADKVFLNLIGDNTLKTTGDFIQQDENTIDAVIFSKEDLTIQGEGSLTITSSKHGIVSKDDLKITGGSIDITSTNHGITANDSIRLVNAQINITSSKDGLHCENEEDTSLGYIFIQSGTYNIESGTDGISSSSIIQIDSGTITLICGGGSSKSVSSSISTKGLKSTSDLIINDIALNISSSDDCIHSNASILIAGGTLNLQSGDDGIHADTSLNITGGNVDILKSYEGLEGQNIEINEGTISILSSDDGLNAAGGNDSSAITGRPGQNSFNTSSTAFIKITGGNLYVNATGDGIDANGSIVITGGYIIVEGPTNDGNASLDYDSSASIVGATFFAIGYSGMAQNFTSAEQGAILYNLSSTQKAQTSISISDSNSNELFSFTTSKSYNSIVLSLPSLTTGSTYTLTFGTETKTITLSSLIYGSSGSMGGSPSMPGFPSRK